MIDGRQLEGNSVQGFTYTFIIYSLGTYIYTWRQRDHRDTGKTHNSKTYIVVQ